MILSLVWSFQDLRSMCFSNQCKNSKSPTSESYTVISHIRVKYNFNESMICIWYFIYLVFGEIEYLSIDNCLTKKQFETFSFQFTPITQISYVRKAVKHQTIKLGAWCVDSNVPSGNKMTVHNRNSCNPRPLFSNFACFHIIISSFRSILFSPSWRTQKTLIIIIVFW